MKKVSNILNYENKYKEKKNKNYQENHNQQRI